MKLNFLVINTLMATGLFAQGPNGFGGRGPYNDGAPGIGPQSSSPDVQARARGGQRRRMGMRGDGFGMRDADLGRLLMDPGIRTQLGVSADQAAKIRQQESDFRKAEIRNNADLQIKRMDLNDLLSADKADRAAIDSKLQEIGTAQVAVEKSAIDYRLTMRDALTPAQRQKLQQIMAQRQAIVVNPPSAVRGPQGGGRNADR